ncbi:DUF397 domain-containing protein [Streptomyces sp. APSN-46.1]|uniref:DUF397 domain-containing protein n=1 Tax=Streptomyces sp. APSN-46.1 TaxID=2929049 RepID=UPI001FB30BB7|nr:DUF397 domain-containing protein [Streptomyces sp. APSN-46.1]MCJ1677203.1 DUF397 domain-containing protein [Streptomyces sp. APSN-46.1]
MTAEIVGDYRKSSYSGQMGDCVEVAGTTDGGLAVRDSKDTGLPGLHCAASAWSAFIRGLKEDPRV